MKYSKSFLSCSSIRSLSKVRYRPVCLSMDWTDTSRWLWAEWQRDIFHANTTMSCMHTFACKEGHCEATILGNLQFDLCIFLMLAILYSGTMKKKTSFYTHAPIVLICNVWNYIDTKLYFILILLGNYVSTVCVSVYFLFSPFSFSSVSLSDSLFSSVTKLKRRKSEKIKQREETANNNRRKLRAHGSCSHCFHSSHYHTTPPSPLKHGSVLTDPREKCQQLIEC